MALLPPTKPRDVDRLSQEDQLFLAAQQTPAADLSSEQMMDMIGPAVVCVETNKGIGSGFMATQNIVVTNYHVVDGAREARDAVEAIAREHHIVVSSGFGGLGLVFVLFLLLAAVVLGVLMFSGTFSAH